MGSSDERRVSIHLRPGRRKLTVLREETTEASDPKSDATPEARGGNGLIRKHIWVVLPLLVLPSILVGLHLKAYQTFSPIDERQHVDYLYRISRGELLRMGEQIGQETLRDEACRGLDWNLFTPPPCHPNRPYNPDIFPNLGYNSAHIHPPTYYVLTNVVAKSFRGLGIARDFVGSARLVGALWLGLALILFWYTARELRIPPIARIIAMVLLATTPTIVHASSTVNPDSMALLGGTAVLLAILVWERKRGRMIVLLPLIGAFAVALKVTNILAVAAGGLYLLLRWWLRRDRARIDEADGAGYLAATSALVAAGVGTAAVWFILHNMLIRVPFDPAIELYRIDGLSIEAVIAQMMALVTPVRNAWQPPFFNNETVGTILQVVNLALLAAVFGALLYERPGRSRTTLAISGALVILGSGMALTLLNYFLNSHTYDVIPARYGISVLPFLFIALASALRRPVVLWAAGFLAAASVVTVGVALVTAI